MINLSEFQRYQQVRKLPNSVRALRAEVIFPPAAMAGGKDDPDCVQLLQGTYRYNRVPELVSVGLRWDFANHEMMKMERDHNVVMEILPESRRSLPTVMLDCRGIHDPDCGRYRGHVGRHLRIIKGVYTLEMRVLLRRALAFYQEHGGACNVVFVRKSGRHRSVSGATLFGAMLRRMAEDNWRYHGDSWRRMDCGGHCEMCNMTEESANSLIEMVENSFPKEQRSVPKPAASRASTPKPVLMKIQSKAKPQSVVKENPVKAEVSRLAGMVKGIMEERDKARSSRGRSRTPLRRATSRSTSSRTLELGSAPWREFDSRELRERKASSPETTRDASAGSVRGDTDFIGDVDPKCCAYSNLAKPLRCRANGPAPPPSRDRPSPSRTRRPSDAATEVAFSQLHTTKPAEGCSFSQILFPRHTHTHVCSRAPFILSSSFPAPSSFQLVSVTRKFPSKLPLINICRE